MRPEPDRRPEGRLTPARDRWTSGRPHRCGSLPWAPPTLRRYSQRMDTEFTGIKINVAADGPIRLAFGNPDEKFAVVLTADDASEIADRLREAVDLSRSRGG